MRRIGTVTGASAEVVEFAATGVTTKFLGQHASTLEGNANLDTTRLYARALSPGPRLSL